MLILCQQSHFLHLTHSDALSFENVVLGGNKKLWTKHCFMIKLSLLYEWHDPYIKIYTTNHSISIFYTDYQMGRKCTTY